VKFLAVVGARPNYMKVAPILGACKNSKHVQPVVVQTSQRHASLLHQLRQNRPVRLG